MNAGLLGAQAAGRAAPASIGNWEPTWRDWTQRQIAGGLGLLGVNPYQANRSAHQMMPILDFTPVGAAYELADAATQAAAGEGSTNLAMAMVPGANRARGAAREALDHAGRISTRQPTAVRATEDPVAEQLSIGLPEFLDQDEAILRHNAGLLGNYPGFRRLQEMEPEQAAEAYVQQTTSNLEHIHDAIEPEIRDRSRLWYEGANRVATDWSQRYDLPDASVAGVLAALSPQKDWFQNASLAERVLDITTGVNIPMTREMMDAQQAIPALRAPAVQPIYENIVGKRLADLDDPYDKALWVRLYDEAHNPRGHRIVTPEGYFGDPAMGQKGPKGTGWGSLNEIAKAVGSIDSGGDRATLSRLMGERHKVRNFYNNILNPFDSYGDVTADTHAVAANTLMPLSGNSVEVAHNFKNSLPPRMQPADWSAAKGSAVTGVHGTYGANVEPYRRAAESRGTLPREMQSITWEGVRGLFPETWKNATNLGRTRQIWEAYDNGQLTLEQAQRAVTDLAGGFRAPDWFQPGVANDGAQGRTSYAGELRRF